MATVKLNMTDLMYIEKFVEKARKMKVLSLERSMNTDVSYIRGEFEKKVWVQGATPNAQHYMNQQIERWAGRMADMNRKTKEEQEAERKSSSKASLNPPTGGTYQEGSVIKLNEGTVKVVEYRFYPDKDQPGISIQLEFIPSDHKSHSYENSPYRWVQTIETNDYVDADFNYLSPPGIMTKRLDIDSRVNSFSSSIKYDNMSIIFRDILGRLPNKDYHVIWKAELSLIKVDVKQNMKKTERLISFSWGFDIPIGSTGNKHDFQVIDKPTAFHLSKL